MILFPAVTEKVIVLFFLTTEIPFLLSTVPIVKLVTGSTPLNTRTDVLKDWSVKAILFS